MIMIMTLENVIELHDLIFANGQKYILFQITTWRKTTSKIKK